MPARGRDTRRSRAGDIDPALLPSREAILAALRNAGTPLPPAVLERELEIFDRGDRPDYEVIRAIISYFELYPDLYHHPQEELVFAKLKRRACSF